MSDIGVAALLPLGALALGRVWPGALVAAIPFAWIALITRLWLHPAETGLPAAGQEWLMIMPARPFIVAIAGFALAGLAYLVLRDRMSWRTRAGASLALYLAHLGQCLALAAPDLVSDADRGIGALAYEDWLRMVANVQWAGIALVIAGAAGFAAMSVFGMRARRL